DGPPNYQIWKQDTTRKTSGLFSLDQVTLDDFTLRLAHHGSRTHLSHLDHIAFLRPLADELCLCPR
ncbi:MAG: hypothetical protein U5L96_17000, partial [Owenweeksia sp.]|nr:hypothetical protein [Owenweeksia sp.]